jgi:hypothetical protein
MRVMYHISLIWNCHMNPFHLYPNKISNKIYPNKIFYNKKECEAIDLKIFLFAYNSCTWGIHCDTSICAYNVS